MLIPCLLYFPFLTNHIACFGFYPFNRFVLLISHIGNPLCSDNGSIGNLELRVSWTAPSGESFYETVYMEKVDSHGVRELYRSGVVPAEYGEWKLNVRPVDPVKDFLGLGLIAIRNDGTR